MDAINAEAGHRVSVGTGALVAVLDSGADSSHPDLAGSVIEGRDFTDGDQTSNDHNGHGTSVTGIIVAHKDTRRWLQRVQRHVTATPHVAAAAALLVSLGLRGGAVVDRLKQTASPLGNALLSGHGLLNMGAAVAGLGPDLPAAARTLTARVRKRCVVARSAAAACRSSARARTRGAPASA